MVTTIEHWEGFNRPESSSCFQRHFLSPCVSSALDIKYPLQRRQSYSHSLWSLHRPFHLCDHQARTIWCYFHEAEQDTEGDDCRVNVALLAGRMFLQWTAPSYGYTGTMPRDQMGLQCLMPWNIWPQRGLGSAPAQRMFAPEGTTTFLPSLFWIKHL